MILFSHRRKIENDFVKWCKEKGAAAIPSTMIAWLHSKKLLNERNVEIYLGLIQTCPGCGGTLSPVREHNGERYRHCYSCHFEWSESKLILQNRMASSGKTATGSNGINSLPNGKAQ